MMRTTHYLIIAMIVLGAVLTLSYQLWAEEHIPSLGGLPEPFHAHAEQLTREKCFTELGLGEQRSLQEEAALGSCMMQEMSVFQGDKDELRQALVRRILQEAAKRTPLQVVNNFSTDSSKENIFYYFTQQDAQVIYHDLSNCYFNIAIDTAMEFYLDKATGTSDSDHNADTKIAKAEYFGLPEVLPHYCFDVYDQSPLLNRMYEKRMTSFKEALLTSVRESKNKEADMGFTALIGKFALEDMEAYFQYLGFLASYPDNTHFASGGFARAAYAPTEQSRDTVITSLRTSSEERLAEYQRAEQQLKAALRAYQNFEQTFPIHIQYKKMQYVSESLVKKIRGIRLAWKFLNVKFDNASIEGGAK